MQKQKDETHIFNFYNSTFLVNLSSTRLNFNFNQNTKKNFYFISILREVTQENKIYSYPLFCYIIIICIIALGIELSLMNESFLTVLS